MVILLVNRAQDHHGVGATLDHLHRQGADVAHLVTDFFRPDQIREEDGALSIDLENRRLKVQDIDALWYRRMSAPPVARRCLIELLNAIPCFQLDPWLSIRRADNKLLQARIAMEEGLYVPATLVSSNPDEVRAFAANFPEGVVVKTLASFAVQRQDEEQVVFTTVLRPEDFEDLSGLSVSPGFFQQRVLARREYRVTVVGQRLFVGVLQTNPAEVDWRREAQQRERDWRAGSLPEPVQAALLRVADRLGLNYGAADILEDSEGRYWFLEINPAGEWGWMY
ncbi:MAG TPA: hypothetical protein PKW90_25400, partial [Myxococcota bacterium]|nr:hypothetical protein [Myxococcota bacterium]